MLTPRLTNCQDCHKIPDLLRQIDCKIAELANGAYNNVVFMLGDCVPATTIVQLLAYKRILTFKYCNPHYGGCSSVNDIAGKVIRLTSGCVAKCNEPTVCEITTCPIPIVPNPTTTTTTTSPIICEFSGNIICIPPTTTTTTTTILPDCRVEGCFQIREIPPPPQCDAPFNTNLPEGFPDGITGNGTKVLSNGVQLTTTYTGPTISPSLLTDPGTEELCDGVLINTYNDTDKTQLPLLIGGSIVLEFDPPVVSVALVSTGYGYSSFLGETETVTVESLDPIVGETLLSCSLNEAAATYETTQVNENQINLTGSQISPSLQTGITVITPEAGGISRLVLTNTTSLPLAGVAFDLYACGGVAPTTTTTTTSQIPVTGNSYFTFWSDVSGSMNSTIAVTAKIASVTGVKVLVSPTAPAGSTEIQLTYGNQANKVTVQDPGGNTTGGAYLCVVPGMEVIHPSIPAGTFVTAGSHVLRFNLVDINGNPVATTADIVQGPNGVVTFNLTDAQKTADYQNTSNLRNLLQDFYATGGTEASGNTDRATNGSDEFESRVYWCHSGEERQIEMLANKGLGDTIGPGGYFPDADNVVILAFGDESGIGYNMEGAYPNAGPRWANRASQTNSRIVDDISSVRTFVTNIESAAGNTNIYRAKFFHPEATFSYRDSTIKPLVSPEGLLNAGNNGVAVVSSIGNVPASAYNSSTDNLINYPSASPARFAWSADLDNDPANPQQYWYDQIRDALIAFGYGV